MNEPTFDIFKGMPDQSPVWLEALRGLSIAEQRMEQIAAESPGVYFLFSVEAHRVFTLVNSNDGSWARQTVNANSFANR
jgi:hypothetical protein